MSHGCVDMPDYDYIIVGAGSAGCVLANKLSKDPSVSVLVIEAGPMDRDIMIHVPAGVSKVWRDPKFNWNYVTDKEAELSSRHIDIPRGKVIGGSSSINSMVYMRGHPLDYNGWRDECGLSEWGFEHCLPYFRAGESSDRGVNAWRGDSGELLVTRGSYDNPLYDAFIEAGAQSGQGYSEDLNGYKPEGVARFDATRGNGKRCSASRAYLKPALKRGNVALMANTLTHKVLLHGARATGVLIEHRGETREIHCNEEVLLCGGAINSPQLLMLSGVGPKAQLADVGIDNKIDSPSVGQHLQDHASVIVQYHCTQRYPIHKVNSPFVKAAAGAYWVFTKKGMAASNIWEAGGLIRSQDSIPYPNIQYHFGPVGFEYVNNKLQVQQGFAIHVDLLRPESRGAVSLVSKNPKDKARLQYNFLSTENDRQQLADGVMRLRELVAQSALDAFRGAEQAPGPQVKTKQDVIRWIRQACETDFHPCGTCRLGDADDCVVDSRFRVHGVDKLRVIDASVMPRIVSGNLNAPTQMIAARAADYILGLPQRPAEHVRFYFDVD